jgi:uncharacterized protein YkwD
MPVLGVNRKKKYLKIFLVLLLIGIVVATYFIYSSGVLADDNPLIPLQFVDRINLERQVNNLPPVQMDDKLNTQAEKKSLEIKLSPVTSSFQSTTLAGSGTNFFAIPKISWAISGYDTRQQMFDTLENTDKTFRANILNSNFKFVGIGVSSDGYNYYIVTNWQ